jgi:Zn-dependent protease
MSPLRPPSSTPPPLPGASWPPPVPDAPLSVPPPAPPSRGETAKKITAAILVGLALIAKFFAKVKFAIVPLLKFLPAVLKTGGTMLLSIWAYAIFFGWQFAVGFVVLIFIHESGHLVAARRMGLNVGAPVFIPFMGAFIALRDAPRNAWIESVVGIGGPVAGAWASAVCHWIFLKYDLPLFGALAYTGYFLNLFNLVPIGQMDGGHVATALSPWLWVLGFAVMGWFLWQHPHNIIIWMMVILGVPRLVSLFRARTADEARYFEVTPAQRWLMATTYFGLMGLLVFGMKIVNSAMGDTWRG